MKIIYLSNGLPHYFNLVLSQMNARQDIDLVVVVPRDTSHAATGVYETTEGINFRVVVLDEYAIKPFIVSLRGLPGLLWRERPDVVMLPDYTLRGFQFHPMLIVLRRLLGFRLVLKSIPFMIPDLQTSIREVRSIWTSALRADRWRPRISKVLEAIARYGAVVVRKARFRMVDAHVVYVDEGMDLYGSYGVSSERIFVTRNSPDTDSLQVAADKIAMAPPERNPRGILFVGRLVEQKRVDLVLKAFKPISERYSDARLTIVGSGPLKSELEKQLIALQLDGVVRFAGAIYDPVNLGKEFLRNSIFVLPGLGGLSINEAMFYGLAVVCSRGDGTERHLVRSDHNGVFFREGDEMHLASVLMNLLADTDRLRRMGERSKEIIRSEVNIDTVVAEYVKAFQYAVGRAG